MIFEEEKNVCVCGGGGGGGELVNIGSSSRPN